MSEPNTKMYFVSGESTNIPKNSLQKEICAKLRPYQYFLTENPDEFYFMVSKIVAECNDVNPRCNSENIQLGLHHNAMFRIHVGQIWSFTVRTVLARYSAKGGYQLYLDEKGGVEA